MVDCNAYAGMKMLEISIDTRNKLKILLDITIFISDCMIFGLLYDAFYLKLVFERDSFVLLSYCLLKGTK